MGLAGQLAACCAIAMTSLLASMPYAQSSDEPGETTSRISGQTDVFVFGGVMTEGTFPGWSMVPFATPLTDSYTIGAAVNRNFVDLGEHFHIGGEIGLAARFGDGSSGELWSGVSFRHDGFAIGPAQIGFGLVTGLSAATGPSGIEIPREKAQRGDMRLLYYAGPEISLTFKSLPRTTFVFRTHHRSGARDVPVLPTLGGIADGSNENLFGVRFSF